MKYDALMDEHKQLEIKYDKKLTTESRNDYESWNAQDIVNWIINLDKVTNRKYSCKLLNNMMIEGIDGECLQKLDMLICIDWV